MVVPYKPHVFKVPLRLRMQHCFNLSLNSKFMVSIGNVPEWRILWDDYFQRHQGWEHKANGRMAAPSGSHRASGRVRRCEALQPFRKAQHGEGVRLLRECRAESNINFPKDDVRV